jgi:ribosomal RNA assembly protein
METIVRVPKDRIAVLIGRSGVTRKALEEGSGAAIVIDSRTGDVTLTWPVEGADPVLMMKLPDLVKAIGRGMAPKKALQLLDDDCYFQLYDMREWVGKQPTQKSRMRGRLIGRDGRIRRMIEENTGCEMSVYGSTVVLIGDEDGLTLANSAVERILRGAEHSTVIKMLERERRQRKMRVRRLDSIEERRPETSAGFEELVPGLADARRRQRRFTNSQVDPEDEKSVDEMMELQEDESITYAEE